MFTSCLIVSLVAIVARVAVATFLVAAAAAAAAAVVTVVEDGAVATMALAVVARIVFLVAAKQSPSIM